MKPYKAWTIAGLTIACVIYFWGDDEPAKVETSSEAPKTPQRTPIYSPPLEPPASRPNYPNSSGPPASGYPYANQGQSYPPVQSYGQYTPHSGYYFRPPEGTPPLDARQQSLYQGALTPQDYGYAPHTPQYQTQPGYGVGQRPEPIYRFRPQDKTREGKRWTGNYRPMQVKPQRQPSGGYENAPYPTPQRYQPTNPNHPSLWANSWPDE